MGKGAMKKGVLKRLMKFLFQNYKLYLVLIALCIVLSAVASAIAGPFLQQVYAALEDFAGGTLTVDETMQAVVKTLLVLLFIYALGWIAAAVMGQIGAKLTQQFMRDIRVQMFAKMQTLPIRYFDRNTHGDIMSTYTNDVDALRQLVSQSLPQTVSTIIVLITLAGSMMYMSIPLFVIVLIGVVAILFVTKKIGGKSAKYFMAQQQATGEVEGYIEEMMHGQKVVKVFCHEEEAMKRMKTLNDGLCEASDKANAFSNMLMPIIHNIGNIMYVIIAFVGCAYVIGRGADNAWDISFSSLFSTGSFVGLMKVSTIVAFLGMARQFANQLGQISNQINSVVMAQAGASRVFDLLDQQPEEDNGYVTLVNARVNENGEIEECEQRTGVWAWKHPHGDGTVTYTRLAGDIVMDDVDFGYEPDKIVLHNVSLYAHPGQKVAFVGATGAGKTTITNLLNRFYDIADGKIRYDGININKIKKDDLRRSLGMVLQDTCLFTGTVMENIRYGRLDATDEQCIEAAKLAGAHDFITRLPEGYETMLVSDGANLSQGQRQLLSIARAAVADAPVMILDEATSSIDTRTEALVTKGMDRLMEGRTVFVIAHRLSTVQNADVIMMLDHGRIIERGTHDDLIAQKGQYYQLYTGKFELE
ncbi:MAG: ABC transporter ATP-binding protein [Firmicutes bacterium]|nr:ABC transporter ATP-binding protein [Bacillota bacterium]MDY5531749.1 ABC transporter ATP-binding protein [Pumilibacteraceae bacterium]